MGRSSSVWEPSADARGRAVRPRDAGDVGASTPHARVLALQRTAGNAAVAALLGGAVPTVQRQNTFYSGQPRSTEKQNPLHTIAEALAADVGLDQRALLTYWAVSDSLAIAKTARVALTAMTNATFTRPDEAAAWLDTPNLKPGTRTDPQWITAVGNLGTVEDQIKGVETKGYNGGHLMAWEFLNEAANVKGNIAPQANTQNKALFRRLERTVMDHLTKQTGDAIEFTVRTPYGSDPYQVTYQQLFERGVINSKICEAVKAKNLLGKSVTIAQMAPDLYDAYALTQSGTAQPATVDKRQAREGIVTHPLSGYTQSVVNKALADVKPPALSILATNVDPGTLQQTAFAFAHHVYLNYRTAVPAPEPDQPRETFEAKRARSLSVVQENLHLAIPILEMLQRRFGLSPTQAEDSLLVALIKSEP